VTPVVKSTLFEADFTACALSLSEANPSAALRFVDAVEAAIGLAGEISRDGAGLALRFPQTSDSLFAGAGLPRSSKTSPWRSRICFLPPRLYLALRG
jgi:plasmid stabilization system protein ParE